jgi:hypothetical protein
MPDLQQVAARLLRAGLWAGTALVAVAGLLHLADGPFGRWERLAAGAGIGVVVAAPFVTLVAMAVAARRSVLAIYAAVTLAFAVLGVLLAR